MPEILPEHAPMPRAFLAWDGTRYRVCSVDAAGQLQVDVIASGLPAGAATAAAQALALAQLQLIEDMRDALQSVATDRLIVRGEDQLHSFGGRLGEIKSGIVSGAGGTYDSDTPPAGVVWVIINIGAWDLTSPTTEHAYQLIKVGDDPYFYNEIRAFGAGSMSRYYYSLWMVPGDVVRCHFIGSLAGDTCGVHLLGHVMTLET